MKKYNKENGIFEHTHNHKAAFDKRLAEGIDSFLENMRLYNIADYGCGAGYYSNYLSKGNRNVIGYEGNKQNKWVYNNIQKADLTKSLGQDFVNAAICLEVGEHIPEKYCDVFLDNITNKSTTPFIILSWALPGQGGTGHMNELSNIEVIEKMKNRGYTLDEEYSRMLREKASFKYFKNTIMVFERDEFELESEEK